MNELERAIEECLKSDKWVERTSAQIVLNKMKEPTSTKYETDEETRALLKFARHDSYCNSALTLGSDCNCGFSEAIVKWMNR